MLTNRLTSRCTTRIPFRLQLHLQFARTKNNTILRKGRESFVSRMNFCNHISRHDSLNEIQKEILVKSLCGKNLFFTGSAGTGKSFLLHTLVSELRKSGNKVAVTASTGIAAEQIGGTTLHSMLGIGSPVLKSDFEKMRTEKISQRWCELDVLIIDEISMVSAEFFDLLEEQVACIRYQRNDYRYIPFGGIQLVVCGDFFQIPPVVAQENPRTARRLAHIKHDGEVFKNEGYCFEARTWHLIFSPESHFELTEVFRQRESSFVTILNQARLGLLTPNAIDTLRQCRASLSTTDGIQPTQLYSRNKGVRHVNETQLSDLPGEPHVFYSVDNIVVQGWNEITFQSMNIDCTRDT
eukprot:TRINITY_DN7617_c0_g2_i11.p1 TRINITY_DN7617_c0_g2~~TRINITY_DN7617_c0_g2_i11.p1  ORF type:complete len:352 (-),score=56.81 TRINITY_DN7617_c0_g2_i11:837-1892(-)